MYISEVRWLLLDGVRGDVMDGPTCYPKSPGGFAYGTACGSRGAFLGRIYTNIYTKFHLQPRHIIDYIMTYQAIF